ncbi:MAG: SRPBCC domain-containing protein [Acidobacteriota bacterium]
MSVKREPSGRRSIQVEVEVPGTPEEVWRAIATGQGVSCWFVPAEIDEKAGTVSLHFGPGMDSSSSMTAWEPPHRFAASGGDFAPGAPAMATEWIVEARSGGTCVVRVVHSLFADTDDWDNQLTDVESGWPTFFHVLRLYLAHHRGQRCAPVQLMAMTPQPIGEAWASFSRAVGLAGAKQGDRRAIQPEGLPQLSGVVEQEAGDKNNVIYRIEGPVPGVAVFMAHDCGGPTMIAVNLYLYGEGAQAVAARDEPLWQGWLSRLFPAPVNEDPVA